MAVRGAVRLAGATAIAVLIGLSGPAVSAQEQPAPAAPTAAPAALSIRDALQGQSTDVTGTAAGGFGGDDTLDVALTLENHTAAPIELTVPRGALFATEDETEQTAVTVGPTGEQAQAVKAGVDPVITLQPGEHTVTLAGFCAQHLDSGPSDIVPMTWAGVAEEPLTTVLTNIAATSPDTTAAQHAVWWVTDVPVLPVPAEVAPLLKGVDTEAFAANPKRVVLDERYTPAWATDQALDPKDPFGDGGYAETPFGFDNPSGDGVTFVPHDEGGGRGLTIGLWLVGLFVACAVIVVAVTRTSRSTPATVAAAGPRIAPAGWHPDPHVPGQLRYWDGQDWTTHIR